MKNIKLSKILEMVIQEVTLPFSKKLINSEIGKKHLSSEESQYKHELDLVKLTIILLVKPNLSFEKLEKASVAHNGLNIPYEEMKKFLNIYFLKVIKFIKNHNLKDTISENLDKYEDFFMEKYHPNSEETETDDFFDFDSEEVDSAINDMHYEEHQKITAKEFMEENSFDSEILYDLNDSIEEYYQEIEFKDNLNESDLVKIEHIFSSFAYIFNLSYEFKDIAYAFEKLNQFLDNFDVSDENKSKMLKMFLDTIIADLVKFKKEVFEDMSANDIHYLDASLLANISQIEISFSALDSNNESDSDDDMFF